MEFDKIGFPVSNAGSWLILLIYIGFWIYCSYSLVIFLIHTRKQNRLLENMELEESND